MTQTLLVLFARDRKPAGGGGGGGGGEKKKGTAQAANVWSSIFIHKDLDAICRCRCLGKNESLDGRGREESC